MSNTKKCWRCGNVKLLDQFSPSARGSNGAMCKHCFAAYMRERNAAKQPPVACLSCNETKSVLAFRRARGGRQKICSACESQVLLCARCGKLKPHDAFDPCGETSTGRKPQCTVCVRLGWKQQRSTPATKKRKKELESRPETKEKNRVWYNQYCVKRRRVDPVFKHKEKARSAVNLAVRKRELTRPATCQHPGKYAPQCSGEIQAHHHMGYDRENWLVVEWLCAVCHNAADLKQRDQHQE